ncbi:hypothetical protein L1987_70419 [Smallanthus sonchifolius]|uniref:Uncharacterized protein n=1 Tax=Smallanthus sonchifolius TaxID=185202 RepID=A0ACB9AQF3_9ASTR|nr:hypothetical protein L1987_70419 [Smallanthus sonchifolius]
MLLILASCFTVYRFGGDRRRSGIGDGCIIGNLRPRIGGIDFNRIHVFLEKFAPEFKKSKEMLDIYLFGDCGSLISTSVVLYPCGITKQMEKFVQQNFLLVKNFKEKLLVIREEDLHAELAKKVLLDHFEGVITNGNLLDEYYNSALEERSQWENMQQIVDGFDRVNSDIKSLNSSEDYLGNINNWQSLFASRAESLQLYTIHEELVKTLNFAGELMNLYGNEETNIGLVEAQLKHLYSLLDLLINFGDDLLNDFMIAHSTLCMVTHALAEIGAQQNTKRKKMVLKMLLELVWVRVLGLKIIKLVLFCEKLVDEKLGENNDDEKNEKYETGPSVKEDDSSNRELRAKEDDVATTDKAGELDPEESNKQNDDNAPDDGNDDVEDMNIDKDESLSEPTGLKPDEPNVDVDDDIDMNQQDDVEHNEDEGTETVDEEENNPDENGPEALTENFEMETEEADQENHLENKTDADMGEQKTDIAAPDANGFDTEHQQNYESATQPNSRSNGASMRSEVAWSNSDDMQSDLAPIQGLPNSSQNEVSVSGSGKLNDEHISQLLEAETPSLQKNEPNPLRNIGDELDGWKERAKVPVDLEEEKTDPMDGGEEDQNADEFGFTSGLEKGTAQALGSAAADQVDKNIDMKESADGVGPSDLKDDSEMDIEDQHHEA